MFATRHQATSRHVKSQSSLSRCSAASKCISYRQQQQPLQQQLLPQQHQQQQLRHRPTTTANRHKNASETNLAATDWRKISVSEPSLAHLRVASEGNVSHVSTSLIPATTCADSTNSGTTASSTCAVQGANLALHKCSKSGSNSSLVSKRLYVPLADIACECEHHVIMV